jgi:hypothetical protein
LHQQEFVFQDDTKMFRQIVRIPKFNQNFKRNLFIQTESTPNVNSLKFKPGVKVMEHGSIEFNTKRESMASPLAKQLFQVQGVKSVFFGPDFVTVTKDDDAVWQLMKPDIFGGIMDFFSTGQEIVKADFQGVSDTEILDTDSEVVAMIKVRIFI